MASGESVARVPPRVFTVSSERDFSLGSEDRDGEGFMFQGSVGKH
jgi:hypothetical protein